MNIAGMARARTTGIGLGGATIEVVVKAGKGEKIIASACAAADGSFDFPCPEESCKTLLESPEAFVRVLGPRGEAARSPICRRRGFLEYCIIVAPDELTEELVVPEEIISPHEHEHDHVKHDGAGHSGHDDHAKHSMTHGPKVRCRTIYLKIEPIQAYCPVAPDDTDHMRYKVDCMRGEGHEDGTIPPNEVDRRRVDAVVYREYLDAAYTVPNTAPIVPADVNEPHWDRRVPGCVIWARPGERLFIHVYNADDMHHSFHVHGLIYGIDSDGSWPFGVEAPDGRRSDAICPGESWCYVFDVTRDTIGAWPFHDHVMDIDAQVARGLFGAIIVRDPAAPKADYEVPLFMHRMDPDRSSAEFDFRNVQPGGAPVSYTFTAEGTYDYDCVIHPSMTGRVRVVAGGPMSANVAIIDSPPSFSPNDVTVGPGGAVTWTNAGIQTHTVTARAGAGLTSYCLNGRAFVGNTPTIVARSGRRIRWYVMDLDLSMQWHNFHLHGQRWQVGGERMDTRSLGPAESFVADSIVPHVLLKPIEGCGPCHAELRAVPAPEERYRFPTVKRGHGRMYKPGARGALPAKAHTHGMPAMGHAHEPIIDLHQKKVTLRGDFLVHCHVEMHMMQGMAGLVRAVETVRLDKDLAECLGFELPVEDGSTCRDVEMPCEPTGPMGPGKWDAIPDLDIFVVHAAMLQTGKVLLWSGTAEAGYPTVSRVWDPVTDARTSQSYAADLFCSGHAWLPDGRLLVAGGAPIGAMNGTHIFDPATETWNVVANMNEARWYPTLVTLADGRVLAASGWGASGVEVWDPGAGNWQLVPGATRTFQELYPSLHLLPSGGVFYSRAGWNPPDLSHLETALLTLSVGGPLTGSWADLGLQTFSDRQEGAAALLVDDTVSPPAAHVYVIGGGYVGTAAQKNMQSMERIDLTSPAGATWTRLADMSQPRGNVTAVLLPDGRILAVGGRRNYKWDADPSPVLEPEMYDPATNTWTTLAPMAHPRQYHSVAVLLPDGRVLTAGGIDPTVGGTPGRDQRYLELFSPPYLSVAHRPSITALAANVAYGGALSVSTPDAAEVTSVVLLRPTSLTHHTDAGLRRIVLPIVSRTATQINTRGPSTAFVAPPGPYMLFLVGANGVPSAARFIRVG